MTISFEELGLEIGKLLESKNRAYGSAFDKAGDFLKVLFPNGVPPEKYTDMLCMVRMFDKMMRIATADTNTNEKALDAYSDMAGYSLLGLRREKTREDPK